jgi:hypothetical protein
MTFRVGMKVVCVNGRGLSPLVSPLVEGCVYTIRCITVNVLNPSRGVGIDLVEIINTFHSNGFEYGYYSDRFRPAVERKTSIEIFKYMLLPQGVKTDA